MRVTNGFLATYADTRTGLLNALGAIPEYIDLDSSKSEDMYFVYSLELSEQDLGQHFTFQLSMLTPLGKTKFLATIRVGKARGPRFIEGAPIVSLFVAKGSIETDEVGRHEFILTHEGQEVSRIPLWVRFTPT